MRALSLVVLGVIAWSGCANRQPAVVIQQNGILSVTIIPSLWGEKFPFEESIHLHELVADTRIGEQIARTAAFHARKRKEWEEFLALLNSPEDRVFRIVGIKPGTNEIFDYFAFVRAGREIKRYYVTGGDG